MEKNEKIKLEALKLLQDLQNDKGVLIGTTFIEMRDKLGLTNEEFKPIILELHQEKQFIVRQGINHKIFFYNGKKK